MKTLSFKKTLSIALLLFAVQPWALADRNRHTPQARPHYQPPARQHYQPAIRLERSIDHRRPAPVKPNRPHYAPGHTVNRLPFGVNRLWINALEYFFFDGFFYRPSPSGYVVVPPPIGAVIMRLPSPYQILVWGKQSFYVVGNTFYRKHPRGYEVVPDPGFRHRR